MKTTLDISRQLNDTNPPAQNVTTETRGVSMDEMEDGSKGTTEGNAAREQPGWWKQSDKERLQSGERHVHLRLKQHKYLCWLQLTLHSHGLTCLCHFRWIQNRALARLDTFTFPSYEQIEIFARHQGFGLGAWLFRTLHICYNACPPSDCTLLLIHLTKKKEQQTLNKQMSRLVVTRRSLQELVLRRKQTCGDVSGTIKDRRRWRMF